MTSVTLRSGVLATDTEYGTALLDEDSGRYWTLNPSAALVVSTLAGGGDTAAAAAALAEQFAVDGERAARDVADLVASLRAAGLVQEG